MVLPETAAAGAAEPRRAHLRGDPVDGPFAGDDGEMPLAVTVSIGASVYPEHGARPATLHPRRRPGAVLGQGRPAVTAGSWRWTPSRPLDR